MSNSFVYESIFSKYLKLLSCYKIRFLIISLASKSRNFLHYIIFLLSVLIYKMLFVGVKSNLINLYISNHQYIFTFVIHTINHWI